MRLCRTKISVVWVSSQTLRLIQVDEPKACMIWQVLLNTKEYKVINTKLLLFQSLRRLCI